MKSVKNLIVPFIILVALVIGVVVYYAVTNSRNSKPSESNTGLINVVFVNSTDIESISSFNRDTSHYAVVKCTTDSNGIMHCEYTGDDALPGEQYSGSGLSDFIYSLSNFYCNAKVSSAGNYAEYGLDNPAFVITIKANNGSVTTVNLGNRTPDGNYCYMYVTGSSDIYTISSDKLAQADKTAINFLDTTVLDIEYSDIKSVHFDRKNDGLSLELSVSVDESGQTQFNVVKPYSHGVSGYFKKLINDITNLQISEYLVLDKSELSSYGLSDPAYHFTISLNNGSKTELYISQNINGYYYGYMNGMDNYFKLSEQQIEGLELTELVLIDPCIFSFKATSYTSITGTYGDKTFKLGLDVPEGKSISSSDAAVTLDGRNAQVTDSSGRSYCSVLFESISGIKIGGIEVKDSIDTSKGAAVTLTFIDKNYNTTVYEFYTRDGDSYYVVRDGVYIDFYVYSTELFNNGGRDTYNYGFWSAYELLNTAISNSSNGTYDIPIE